MPALDTAAVDDTIEDDDVFWVHDSHPGTPGLRARTMLALKNYAAVGGSVTILDAAGDFWNEDNANWVSPDTYLQFSRIGVEDTPEGSVVYLVLKDATGTLQYVKAHG